jgi:uncharacterized protein YjbI with pentapeptide repeats
MDLRENSKAKLEDQEVVSNVEGEDLSRKELVRMFAVGLTFTNTSFKQSVLSSCYFRNCRFIKCDFTGATIKESNFKGARPHRRMMANLAMKPSRASPSCVNHRWWARGLSPVVRGAEPKVAGTP